MLKLAFVVVASYVLLVAVVYFTQARMLYLPNMPGRALTMTPANAGMDYQDVSIESADGVTLHGWFVEGQSSRVLLFFHGNAGNISHRLDSIRQFHRLGLSVLIIDYRGYGQSSGKTTEKGIYSDAEAAWRYLAIVVFAFRHNFLTFKWDPSPVVSRDENPGKKDGENRRGMSRVIV